MTQLSLNWCIVNSVYLVMALTYQQIHKNYSALASDRSAVNWLNNGAFTSYTKRLKLIKNNSIDRIDPDGANRAVVDLVDPELYSRDFYSFPVPKTAGQQFIGSWDISGVSGSVAINPIDKDGNVYTSYDGGNFLVVSGSETGSITMNQKIEYFQPLAGQDVTISISGRKLQGPVKAEFSLVDGEVLHTFDTHAQFFGDYRRFHKSFKLKDDLQSLTFRVKLTGATNWSIGLSGLSLTLGNNPIVAYTHSIADLAIPRGTVFMFTGDACPSGYVPVANDQRMAVVRGAPNYHVVEGEAVSDFGYDEHDHMEIGGQPDALFPPSDERTTTAIQLPKDASRFIWGVPYRDPVVWETAGQAFTDEDATAALGIRHGHSLRTKMSSLPPTFKILFCEKL